MCHLLLALPLLGLAVFWLLPLAFAIPVYGVMLAVSLLVYVYAWKAMRLPRLNGVDGMLGASGTVTQVGARTVNLTVYGERWTADVNEEAFAPGDKVIVTGIEGLRLRIRMLGALDAKLLQ